jgi:hypothetical protein
MGMDILKNFGSINLSNSGPDLVTTLLPANIPDNYKDILKFLWANHAFKASVQAKLSLYTKIIKSNDPLEDILIIRKWTFLENRFSVCLKKM